MADQKLSALTTATTPLAGTEELYLVQGGTSKKVAASAFQAPLVSGTSIKTVNSTSLLGSGDVAVQPTLVSGTNIKTVNGSSLLGSGDLTISSTGSGTKTYRTFTPLDNQPPASAFATLDTRNSVAVLDFDAATDEAAVFVGHIPQGATLTSGIKVIISWAATSATSGDCVWGAQWEKTTGHDIDGDGFDTATTATTTTNAASGVVNTTTITCTAIDSLAAGDCFRLKVYRDADNGSDTMTGDAELIAVEIQGVA